jgi:hypothetical protein
MRLSFLEPDDVAAQPVRDWSQRLLTLSIVLSLSIVMGSAFVRLGMRLAEGNRLKKQGVALCVELRHPPGSQTRDPAIGDECAQLVERAHDACLSEARAEQPEYKKQRHPYMACIMSAWPAAHAAR